MARKGRPSKYSQELADEICERLAKGRSLRQICTDEDMPGRSAVLRWLRDKEDFRSQYAHAREEQADFWADEIIEISDAPMSEPFEVQQAKLRSDNRKWIASKLKPKKYGDRVQNDVNLGDSTLEALMAGRQRANERNKPED